jgi:hypothetical protein
MIKANINLSFLNTLFSFPLGSWGTHPASYAKSTGLIPWGWSDQSVTLTTDLHLVKDSWSYTSTPRTPSWLRAYLSTGYFFMAWYLVKHRDNFIFTFTWSFLGFQRLKCSADDLYIWHFKMLTSFTLGVSYLRSWAMAIDVISYSQTYLDADT